MLAIGRPWGPAADSLTPAALTAVRAVWAQGQVGATRALKFVRPAADFKFIIRGTVTGTDRRPRGRSDALIAVRVVWARGQVGTLKFDSVLPSPAKDFK